MNDELTPGEILRACRLGNTRHTQETLAVVLGVSRGAVGQWERDEANPSLRRLNAVYGALSMTDQQRRDYVVALSLVGAL